jgi:hypothetical protein
MFVNTLRSVKQIILKYYKLDFENNFKLKLELKKDFVEKSNCIINKRYLVFFKSRSPLEYKRNFT